MAYETLKLGAATVIAAALASCSSDAEAPKTELTDIKTPTKLAKEGPHCAPSPYEAVPINDFTLEAVECGFGKQTFVTLVENNPDGKPGTVGLKEIATMPKSDDLSDGYINEQRSDRPQRGVAFDLRDGRLANVREVDCTLVERSEDIINNIPQETIHKTPHVITEDGEIVVTLRDLRFPCEPVAQGKGLPPAKDEHGNWLYD